MSLQALVVVKNEKTSLDYNSLAKMQQDPVVLGSKLSLHTGFVDTVSSLSSNYKFY